MTDEELDSYAGRLADAAVATTCDPGMAIGVLMQAAIAIMVAKVPGAACVSALEGFMKLTIDSFGEFLQPEGMVQ